MYPPCLQEGQETLGTRVTGGLVRGWGGVEALNKSSKGTQWVLVSGYSGLVAVVGEHPRDEGAACLTAPGAGTGRRCSGPQPPRSLGQTLPAWRGHHRAAWAAGAVARRR